MPIYEYRCKHCDTRFDVLQRVGEDGEQLLCPECEEKGAERVPSVFAATDNEGSGNCSTRGGFT